jgi:23S rRNA (cytosine1962-C5)-methyltransferase
VRTVRLKKNEDRRVRAGHLWIFSNEIANIAQEFTPGEIVEVVTYGGTFVGRGYINPRSLISVRLLTREREPIDRDFFVRRIGRALSLRHRIYPEEDTYRAVFGEADLLPGLVIDKYGDVLVLQVSTLGMQQRLGELLGSLPDAGLKVRAVVLRTDELMAELEGFAPENRVLSGELEGPVRIEKHGLLFDVDVLEGQKTGFFLDQQENRRETSALLRDWSVLDCFCYTGAWSLSAAKSGARRVVGIDSSARAIEMARQNAALNSFGSACSFEEANVFEKLEELAEDGAQFDCVILDPPALVKSKKHLAQGEAGYEKLNRLAMRLLPADGLLISCSCSFHVSRERFQQTLSAAARKERRTAAVLEWRGQSRDHPTLLAMPETAYLKCAVTRVM